MNPVALGKHNYFELGALRDSFGAAYTRAHDGWCLNNTSLVPLRSWSGEALDGWVASAGVASLVAGQEFSGLTGRLQLTTGSTGNQYVELADGLWPGAVAVEVEIVAANTATASGVRIHQGTGSGVDETVATTWTGEPLTLRVEGTAVGGALRIELVGAAAGEVYFLGARRVYNTSGLLMLHHLPAGSVPRSECDADGSIKGLGISPATTNLVTTPIGDWTRTGATITDDWSLLGSKTAVRVHDTDAGTATRVQSPDFAVAASTDYVISIVWKAHAYPNYDQLELRIFAEDGGGALLGVYQVRWQPSDGVYINQYGSLSVTSVESEALGGGWYRTHVYLTTPASTATLYFLPRVDPVSASDTGADFTFDLPSIVEGSAPPPILAAVDGAPRYGERFEIIDLQRRDLHPWWSGSEGTLLLRVRWLGGRGHGAASTWGRLLRLDDGTADNAIEWLFHATNDSMEVHWDDAGVPASRSEGGGSFPRNTSVALVLGWQQGTGIQCALAGGEEYRESEYMADHFTAIRFGSSYQDTSAQVSHLIIEEILITPEWLAHPDFGELFRLLSEESPPNQ